MPLTNITYPITETSGQFSNNIFPSQKPLNFTARRIDQAIAAITSGTDGVVRINCASPLTGVGLGDFVAFGTDSYSPRTSLVINVIDPNTIEVDEVFTSTNVTNSFINYLKDYFLEIRYVEGDSVSDDQAAIQVLKDFSQVPNDVEGNIVANIALPSDLVLPTVVTSTQVVDDMSSYYKIQYRESFAGTRDGTWVSPSVDAPILLIHAATSALEGFTDVELTKLYTRQYPVYYSYVHSSVNEVTNEVTISCNEYDIKQNLTNTKAIATLNNVNGYVQIVVLPGDVAANTVFLEFTAAVISDTGQYDPVDYETATDYA